METKYCNYYKKDFNEDNIFTCEHDELTYHIDCMKCASDGAEVFEDNLDAYEEEQNLDNFPEYDSYEAYSRF